MTVKSQESALRATNRNITLLRYSTVIVRTHFTLREIGYYQMKCTSRNIEVGKDSDKDVVVYQSECLAEVDPGSQYSCRLLMVEMVDIVEIVELEDD